MTLFSLLESLFFMSLAMSFLLIFLMVYHFKKRMDSLDRKNETLGDICKTLVQEIESVKCARAQPLPSRMMMNPQHAFESFCDVQNGGEATFLPLEDFFRKMKASSSSSPSTIEILEDQDVNVVVDVIDDDDEAKTDSDRSSDDSDSDSDSVTVTEATFKILDDDDELVVQIIEDDPPQFYASASMNDHFENENVSMPSLESIIPTTPSVDVAPTILTIIPPIQLLELEEPLEGSVIDGSVLTEPDSKFSKRTLNKMTVQMLRDLAAQEGHTAGGKMKKKELMAMFIEGV